MLISFIVGTFIELKSLQPFTGSRYSAADNKYGIIESPANFKSFGATLSGPDGFDS